MSKTASAAASAVAVAASAAAKAPARIVARVKSVSCHMPQRSAIVATRVPQWNKRFQKYFTVPKHYHISDPTGAVRMGDTVAITRWPSIARSRRCEYTVDEIICAGGDGALSLRPQVLSEKERRAWRTAKLLEKGHKETQKGLREGYLVVGSEGKVVDVRNRYTGATEEVNEDTMDDGQIDEGKKLD